MALSLPPTHSAPQPRAARSLRAALAACVRCPHGTRGLGSGHPTPDARVLDAHGARSNHPTRDGRALCCCCCHREEEDWGEVVNGSEEAVEGARGAVAVAEEYKVVFWSPPTVSGVRHGLGCPMRERDRDLRSTQLAGVRRPDVSATLDHIHIGCYDFVSKRRQAESTRTLEKFVEKADKTDVLEIDKK
ncbi:hypothetical protein ABZP36_025316 [Zizania latifolia]